MREREREREREGGVKTVTSQCFIQKFFKRGQNGLFKILGRAPFSVGV